LIEVSVSTTFIADGLPLHDALKLCQDVGIKSVEIGSNHCYEEHYDYLGAFNFQYLVHNYFPIPQISFVLNIASIDEQIRTLSLQHVKKALDLCEKTDAKLYTFHPGFLTDPKGSNQSNINYDFQWEQNRLSQIDRAKAKDLMYQALDEVVKYAALKKIKIAIETEGSLKKKGHLLMQQPHEYEEFMTKFSVSEIGINLNIGHLNLAANAFDFDRIAFVELVQDHIVAMELSHNDGEEDQHQPLQSGEWYWDIINDRRFESAFKILEFRNTQIAEIARNVQLIRGNNNEFSVSG
jgi:sugar phosphate isomerase/epimerase